MHETAAAGFPNHSLASMVLPPFAPYCQEYSDESSYSPYIIEKPFGSCGLVAGIKEIEQYCRKKDRDVWISAVDELSPANGGDVSESQSIALFRAAFDWTWSVGALTVRLNDKSYEPYTYTARQMKS